MPTYRYWLLLVVGVPDPEPPDPPVPEPDPSDPPDPEPPDGMPLDPELPPELGGEPEDIPVPAGGVVTVGVVGAELLLLLVDPPQALRTIRSATQNGRRSALNTQRCERMWRMAALGVMEDAYVTFDGVGCCCCSLI